jgi:hypothetical protein
MDRVADLLAEAGSRDCGGVLADERGNVGSVWPTRSLRTVPALPQGVLGSGDLSRQFIERAQGGFVHAT